MAIETEVKPYQFYDYDNPPKGKVDWRQLEQDIHDILEKNVNQGLPNKHALYYIAEVLQYHTQRGHDIVPSPLT